jgi:hypothetical protein
MQSTKDTKGVIRSRRLKEDRQYNRQKNGFWWPLWYLLAIVLSVLLQLTASDDLFGIFWRLYCLSFFNLRLLMTPLVSFGDCIVCLSSTYGFWWPLWYLLAIVLFVFLQLTASDDPFGIFWRLYCLSFFNLRLLMTPLVSFVVCIVCPSSTYGFLSWRRTDNTIAKRYQRGHQKP